ncbi:DUF4376 domain-containing protein [Eikenella corrodens]|uniref:DUF4376 domain-containing protein n=1 Tax=Eikenella corrodens TaxID=539 RepID=UPI001F011935|nr:DUF4376 domain-containing protein [Eikenella corrodens]
MTLYYSQSSGGFYDSTIHSRLPEDAVAISPEQHAALLAGQSAGQVIMPGKDGKPVLAEQPPCPSSTWDGEQWHIDPECAAQLKAEQQDEMWERIKAKRYDNLRHGVYIKSVGKWFQTDDATRLQYLALALESVTGGFKKPINWKTMDNSFLMLTPELLREIMQTMHDDEEADFINAEKHKAAMLQAENPLKYDYSDGWTVNFDEPPAAELEEAEK